jgi:predicted nuclease with TOPRIM domain
MPLSQNFELGTQLNSALVATAAGLIVGAIIKFANKLFDSKKNELEEHVTLRKELREELDSVKEELYKLQEELNDWREKYFHQVELTNTLKMDILRLTDELTEYKRISGIYPSSNNNNGWTGPDEFIK